MSTDVLEKENRELKFELEKCREEIEKLRLRAEETSKQVDRLSRTEVDLNNELAAANKTIGDNRSAIDDFTFRMGSTDVEMKLYKDELQDLRSKWLESQKEAKSYRDQLEDMKISARRESSINFRISSSLADDDGADFGVGHDLIHDHDHQETETKIQTLEKTVEELHRSLQHAEEENETLRALLEKYKGGNGATDVDSILSVKAEMSALLEAKEAEISNLRNIHDEALYTLRSAKDEEIFQVTKKAENSITQMQKNIDNVESEKSEILQMYNAMCAKQDYLARTIPSSFLKSSVCNGDGASAGIANRNSLDLISNETSLEKAVKAYIDEGTNDDVLQEMNNLALKYEKQKLRNTKLLNKLQSARGNIQVCCRTRPPSSDESSAGGKTIVDGRDESELSCYDWKIQSWKPFGFDHVWPPEATQADVFSDVEPLIASVAEGFNVCIFAYGQTGSGKTYTMEGYGTDYGIYYRSIQRLFELTHSKSFGASLSSAASPTPSSTATTPGAKKPPLSHMPSSAHASASQRRLPSTSQPSPSATPTASNSSTMEKLFGVVNSDRNSVALNVETNSEQGCISSSVRSENNESPVPFTSEEVHAISSVPAPLPGVAAPSSVKSLVKQPSLFEFSNPISRRRSTLHVTSHAASDTKKDSAPDEYHFLSDRDDQQSLIKVKIEMSMLEIYNEQVYDLLTDRWTSSGNNGTGGSANASMALDLRQGTDGQVNVNGLSTIEVKDMQEAMSVFAKGASNRATASTQLNAHSSRSHLIVQIDVVTECADDSAGIHSKLFLVDLAGSERIEKSGATGSVLKEAQYINRSLLSLGDVMEALDKKQSHVPYRNSKLTHLLQNALGGNARCMMIATVCPTDLTYDETMFTLQFATRVRNINLGIAHRNSNVKNLEEALKLTRVENRELKRKRQALEEALNIAKKEGTAGKLGDKFYEAKIKQLEETKKVGDSLIQQLQKQLHDANGKLLEERRLREQAGVDAELLQRNLKKTTDQLKLEQEKSRHLAADAAATAPSSSSTTPAKSSITPMRVPASSGVPVIHNKGSSATSTSFPSTPLLASKVTRGGLTPGNVVSPTPTGSTVLSSSKNASTKTPSGTGSSIASSSMVSKIPVSASKLSVAVESSQSDLSNPITIAQSNDTNAAEVVPPVVASETATEDKAKTRTAATAPASPTSEAKRLGTSSPYKAAFAAMIQKQQMQVNAAGKSPSAPSAVVPAPSANIRNGSTIHNIGRIEQQSSSSRHVKKTMSEKSMDESSDEEIFQVLIPDKIVEDEPAPQTPTDTPTEAGRKRMGMGERKVSLEMILDDLSVASVDDESLTVLSQSTGASSHASHARSTLAKRIALNNPGLYQPGLVDSDIVSAINNSGNKSKLRSSPTQKTPVRRGMTTIPTPTRLSSSPSSSSKRSPMMPMPLTPGTRSNINSRRPSPSSSVIPLTSHSPVSRMSSASPVGKPSSSPATTASARAAMVTTSSATYRKPQPPGGSGSSDGQSVRSNGSGTNGSVKPVANMRTPFSNSGNTPSAAAQLRQVINSVPISSMTGRTTGATGGHTSQSPGSGSKIPPRSAPTTPGTNGGVGTPGTASGRQSLLTRTPTSASSTKQSQIASSPRSATRFKGTSKTPTTPKTAVAAAASSPSSPTMKQQSIPVPALHKTPPSISDRAKAALDQHKNRMASREADKMKKQGQ